MSYKELPVQGGIANVCLVGRFSNVDATDRADGAGLPVQLDAHLDGWYLVRRTDGQILGMSTPEPSQAEEADAG
jgi:hypothetical protein